MSVLPFPESEFGGVITDLASTSTPSWPSVVSAPDGAPNVLLIMTDDVGFGSADTFGGPIHTPSMTRIGDAGLKYNRFHTTALCSPTRAALLTGRHPHNVGTGMVIDLAGGYPGYNSCIPHSCATVGQVLRMNGYNTAWFGKNHNIPIWEVGPSGPFDQWPNGLGFEHFYGFNSGEADQRSPLLYRNTTPVEPYEGKTDYYLDSDLADEAIQYIKERTAVSPNKPWFCYYVPGACHSPHQVPQEFIDKYKGKFDDGWDELRKSTWQRQLDMGIIPSTTELTPRPPEIPAWDGKPGDEDWDEKWPEHTELRKKVYCRMAEVYAAFLEHADFHIGRVLDCLDELEVDGTPIAENTLVIYIQGDNGGSAEGSVQGSSNDSAVLGGGVVEPWDFVESVIDELGSEFHSNHMPLSWAWALNSPMQWAKRYASHFGATRNGMVMRWPKRISDLGGMRQQFHHVIDIMPTILAAAGVTTPTVVNGTEQKKLDGVSMTYTWESQNESREDRPEMIFEMSGNRGLYQDGWMLCTTPLDISWITKKPKNITITEDSFDWELYNVAEDFSQASDYLKLYPNMDSVKQRKDDMYDRLMTLARENQITPLAFTLSERKSGKKGQPGLRDRVGTFVYPGAFKRIPEKAAPDCTNMPYTIDSYINVPEGMDGSSLEGMLYCMGGRFGGFGCYLLGGRLVYAYKIAHWESSISKIEVDVSSLLPPGEHMIRMFSDYLSPNETGGPATNHIIIDGEEVGRVEIEATVSSFFSSSEALNIGQDTGTPVMDEYKDMMPFKFNAPLIKTVFSIDDSNITDEMKEEIEEAKEAYELALD